MSEIIFVNDSTIYDVDLSFSKKRAVLIFSDKIPHKLLGNGFVELNENNNKIVQGNYEDYKYTYREETNSLKVTLTTDSTDIYVEPESEEVEPYVPTDDELEEQERLNRISEIHNEINMLKTMLESTDYQVIKTYEYSSVNLDSDYDMYALHAERQALRDEINALELELSEL